MQRRDHFALVALHGLIGQSGWGNRSAEEIAARVFRVADAMEGEARRRELPAAGNMEGGKDGETEV